MVITRCDDTIQVHIPWAHIGSVKRITGGRLHIENVLLRVDILSP